VELYILRHGEAGDALPMGGADAERALTMEGKKEVADVCKRLSKVGLKFDRIATSPLKRAKETAEIAGREFGIEVEEWAELKPEAKAEDLGRRLSRQKRDSSVLLVGHEPFLTAFIGEVVGAGPEAKFILKKAGLARVSITGFVPRMTGELRWLLSPKTIRRLR